MSHPIYHLSANVIEGKLMRCYYNHWLQKGLTLESQKGAKSQYIKAKVQGHSFFNYMSNITSENVDYLLVLIHTLMK